MFAKDTFHLIKIKNGSPHNFIDMSNTKGECKDRGMVRCSCKTLFICTEVHRKLLSVSEEIYEGFFEVMESELEKVQAFRKICIYNLGLAGANVKYLRIRKHHFHIKVLRFLQSNQKILTMPNSRAKES